MRAAQRRHGFLVRLLVVVGALVLVGGAMTALSSLQGPRITSVEVDTTAATLSAGSRIILTTNQPLDDLDPSQVTVTPEAEFTVDTSGRNLGIRFTYPLWDDTEYTVTISGITSVGGSTETAYETSFTTPPLSPLVLQRSEGGEDRIVAADLAGGDGETIFTANQIEDFRATATTVVASTWDDETGSTLTAMDADGSDPQPMRLPGEGTVTNLQSADRGNVVGYVYTDADVGTPGAIENALYTTNVSDPDAEPQRIQRPGGDSRIVDWRFVPGTDSILMITFDGALTLVTSDGGEVSLGNAVAIDGIARGSTVAIVERNEGVVAIDLTDGSDVALVAPDVVDGLRQSTVPLPGDERIEVWADSDGINVATSSAYLIGADGSAFTVFDIPADDAVLQTCVSPSGRYAAFLVAPNVVDNAYDGYQLPLPTDLETHIVDVESGESVATVPGGMISWCQNAPPL